MRIQWSEKLAFRVGHREDHGVHSIAGGSDRLGQGTGEGGDAASTRGKRPDERDREGGALLRRRAVVRFFEPDSIDDTQVTIADRHGEKVSLPWSSIERLDLQVGLRRQFGKAVLFGGGIGLGLGLLLPLPKPDYCLGDPCSGPLWTREQQVLLAVSAGILGGLIAEAASSPSGSRWERVRPRYRPPAATSFGFGAAPGRGGVAFRWALSF